MSIYDQSSRPRRQRYYDDEDDFDDYGPPKPRERERDRDQDRKSRPQPPPGPSEPVRDHHLPRPPIGQEASPRSSNRDLDTSNSDGRSARRRSILIDPDETASQRERRRSSRSRSNVRLQVRPPSDDDAGPDDARDGQAPRRRRRNRDPDLESKNGPEDRQFRSRRDGIESDEGETLRREGPSGSGAGDPSRRRRSRRYDDDDDKQVGAPLERRKSLSDRIKDKFAAVSGGKPRERSGPHGVEYGDAPIDTAAGGASGPSRRERRRDFDDPDEAPRRRERRPRRDDYDDYDDPPRPRRRAPDDDRGYRSDAPPSRPRRRNDDYYDEPPRPRRTRDEDPYAGADRPRRRPPPRDYYDDDEGYGRAPPRRRHADDYDDDARDSRRGGPFGRARARSAGEKTRGDLKHANKEKNMDWQKELSTAFMTMALPYIKSQGVPMMKKELTKFLEKQNGR